MHKQDEVFRCVVLSGMSAGLQYPQEWLADYDSRLPQLYRQADVNEVKELMGEVLTDFVSADLNVPRPQVTAAQKMQWLNKYIGEPDDYGRKPWMVDGAKVKVQNGIVRHITYEITQSHQTGCILVVVKTNDEEFIPLGKEYPTPWKAIERLAEKHEL